MKKKKENKRKRILMKQAKECKRLEEFMDSSDEDFATNSVL